MSRAIGLRPRASRVQASEARTIPTPNALAATPYPAGPAWITSPVRRISATLSTAANATSRKRPRTSTEICRFATTYRSPSPASAHTPVSAPGSRAGAMAGSPLSSKADARKVAASTASAVWAPPGAAPSRPPKPGPTVSVRVRPSPKRALAGVRRPRRPGPGPGCDRPGSGWSPGSRRPPRVCFSTGKGGSAIAVSPITSAEASSHRIINRRVRIRSARTPASGPPCRGSAFAANSKPTPVGPSRGATSRTRAVAVIPSPTNDTARDAHNDRNAGLPERRRVLDTGAAGDGAGMSTRVRESGQWSPRFGAGRILG